MVIWHRFEQVTSHIHQDHKLFRASAPNYDPSHGDEIQDLTQDAVDFLTQNAIESIISFNFHPYSDAALALLRAAGIEYHHLPVVDAQSPTLDLLKSAYTYYMGYRGTLIHCGYGHGRTGTGVTGVQLHVTNGTHPHENLWRVHNHVEEDGQMDVLRTLRDSFSIAE